jgi:hypothetical protein
MRRAALAFALVGIAGCAAEDPCAAHNGACLALRIEDHGGVLAIDQLLVTLTGAAHLNARTPDPPGALTSLPVAVAIFLPCASLRPIRVP